MMGGCLCSTGMILASFCNSVVQLYICIGVIGGKSIYDMMGKYTYPSMQDDAPREHVESFFQVKLSSLYYLLTPHFIIV